jgi:pimeloyl-ACP methyl ester carboxylesterase
MTELLNQQVDLGEAILHVTTAGAGDAVVLLHGWPQTSHEWRNIIPALADTYLVIAPDLRGLGNSSRPSSGYDKAAVAGDVFALLKKLGIDRPVRVVGHDWGGIVAYAMAAAHEDLVSHLGVIDVVTPLEFAGLPLLVPQGVNPAWHFAFHMVPELPENLLEGKEDLYLRWWFKTGSANPAAFDEADIRVYVDAYRRPGAMHAGLEYYRAVDSDVAMAERFSANKLKIPVLVVEGQYSFGGWAAQSWSRVAEHIESHVIPNCGHWVTEERPKELAELLKAFLAR